MQTAVPAKGDQGNGTYINPILAGDYADPTVVRVGNDYYMTHSCFEFAPGFLIWHSTDLVNWEPIAKALTEYAGNVWAPDLVYYKGQFYIYAPIDEEIMVLTAAQPTGPWGPPVKVGIRGIDPGHVADDDGNRYLFYGSGYVAELTPDGLSVKGAPRKVYDGWRFPEEWVVEGRFLESPKLTYLGGYFYLTVAQGGSSGPATSHMVASARSKHPLGPYEDSPYNPIVRTQSRSERWLSKGHGSIVDTPDGDWWMVYHAFENGYYTLGRQTLLEPLEWTEDGWFRILEGVSADQPIRKPSGRGLNRSECFPEFQTESGDLGYAWSWYKSISPIEYEIDRRAITISSGSSSAPLVFMPGDHHYEAQVEIDLSGEETSGRFVLFYSDKTYSGLELSGEGLHGVIRGWRTPAKPWPSRHLVVRLRYSWHEVIFDFSLDGTEWTKFEHSFETSGWHHNALGGFLALRLALWAQGQGKVTFKNFEYRALNS
ncbi:family 43 glycosylhydrolase [Paenibacillus sp. LHD-117]|uniref:family 43 glycosylhydrolase n=1 Tax=Paenibacillus sp. LHD-117 TaxID=3071412 RepID=UPI0027DF9670|nr:family 43 glycosylhydrolase [Paenibacillus sp. LHD-117]MDQ6417936.1 family 43 glycosylhydrolase [Paenibacillus sp. LHD-117]